MSPNYHKSLNISMTCAFYCCFHKKVFLNIVTSLSPSVIFSMIMEAADCITIILVQLLAQSSERHSTCITGVWEYIEQTRDKVHDLETRVQKAKDNVEDIQKIMTTWSKQPLFERKEEKNDTLLNLDDREDRLNKRYTDSIIHYF